MYICVCVSIYIYMCKCVYIYNIYMLNPFSLFSRASVDRRSVCRASRTRRQSLAAYSAF